MVPLLLNVLKVSLIVGIIAEFLLDEEEKMFDRSKKIKSFHDDEVLLDKSMKEKLIARRDTNRTRVKDNLEDLPTPRFHRQGSIAMGTIIQCPDEGLDIDDGIYFYAEDLKKEDGSEYNTSEIKEKIKKAVSVTQFKKQPEIMPSCVRVFYNEGYHIDLPSYRELEDGTYELAGEKWTESDPKTVTDWFVKAVKEQSPEDKDEQLREIVRLMKKFVKKWDNPPSGFTISALCVEECYRPHTSRIDTSLYDTMKALHQRLVDKGFEVDHPVVDDQKLTKGPFDSKMQKFKDELKGALDDLQVLFDKDCTEEKADKAWGKVFNARDYFTASLKNEASADAIGKATVQSTKSADIAAAAIAAPAILKTKAAEALENHSKEIDAVKKRGGGEGYGFG